MIYCRAKENGWIMFKYPKLPDGFERKVFIGKIWGEGWRILWLFSDRLAVSNRVVFQKCCAQPEVTILHLGGGLSSYKIDQRYCYIYSWRRSQDPASRVLFFSLTDPPLFLYSLCSLICYWWCSVANLCPTLCNPMDCTPGFSVLHHLLELAQTHVHWVGDAIQLSHPLSSPSPPAFSLSQQRAWICSLEIRESQGGWMKLISYKQEKGKWRAERHLCPGGPDRGPVQFHKHTEEHTQKRSYRFQPKIVAMEQVW